MFHGIGESPFKHNSVIIKEERIFVNHIIHKGLQLLRENCANCKNNLLKSENII